MAYLSDSFFCHSERSEESRLLVTCNNQILRSTQDDNQPHIILILPS